MKSKKLFLIALLAIFCFSNNVIYGQCKKYYVKRVKFPENASIDKKVNMASRLIPTKQQYDWQKMELTAFLHFGINTFTGREWGDGRENPEIFNPEQLDAEQWVKVLKESGFKMVILTAKHHDGFCLWPTKTTKHSVESAKWKNGKGDVVKELREACDKYNMKFGVYLSPWDRNAKCYGDSPKYNEFFIEQLTELLTNYGEVHEVWFDGANGEGPNGKKQIYDWDAFYKTIQKLQPKAVMAIMGDDVRWVGNERGIGRETEWSATVLTPGIYNEADRNNSELNIQNKSKDLGSRDIIAKAKELFWYPSEVDVSIRPGWFYHKQQDNDVKSLKHLVDIYYQSVGYNSVLLLNIPPDKRGLISDFDVNRLYEFSNYLKSTFSNNYIVSPNRYNKIKKAGDEIVYDLKGEVEINNIMIQEDIMKGQRVENFTAFVYSNNIWKEVAKGTTIGYKRIVRFDNVKATKIKIRIDRQRNTVNINSVGAFLAKEIKEKENVSNLSLIDKSTWKLLNTKPIIVDLGKDYKIKTFIYSPINAEYRSNIAVRYNLYVSKNGVDWDKIADNEEFSNIINNPIPQIIKLKKEVNHRYIKVEGFSLDGESTIMDKKEIDFSEK